MDLLFGETRKCTIMANNDLELLALNKKHFSKIFFSEFREIGSEIYKNALKRKLRATKIQKEAIEYCRKENFHQHSFSQRNSLFNKKNKSKIFYPQTSIAKDYQSSLKESEVFTASYKPFNKESFYVPIHSKDMSHKIDLHLNSQLRSFKRKNLEKSIEYKASLNSGKTIRKESDEGRGSDSKIEGSLLSEFKLKTKNETIKTKNKGSYLEKFTSMLAQAPDITKNYIPFDLDLEDKGMKQVSDSLKKVDELQEKITKMDKNMEEIINVFKSLGINLQ